MELSFCMYLAWRYVEVGFEARRKSFCGSWDILEKPPSNSSKVSGCRGAVCPGGELLAEVETSPLQVIWRLRVGAALWSFGTVIWEPDRPKKAQILWFSSFLHPRVVIIISSPREKWYPEWWYGAELLHVPRLKVCRGESWSSSKIFLRILGHPWKTTLKFF